MQGGVRSPGPPALGARAQRARPADARGALQRAIPGRKGVRPAERADQDLGREPIADAVDRPQRAARRDDVAARCERELAAGDGPRRRRESESAAWRDAERPEAGGAPLRDSIRGGREAVQTWDPGGRRVPKPPHPPPPRLPPPPPRRPRAPDHP